MCILSQPHLQAQALPGVIEPNVASINSRRVLTQSVQATFSNSDRGQLQSDVTFSNFVQSIGNEPTLQSMSTEGLDSLGGQTSPVPTTLPIRSKHSSFKTRRSLTKHRLAYFHFVILFANITSASFAALSSMRAYLDSYSASAVSLVETHNKLTPRWIKKHLKGTHVVGGAAAQSDS